MYKENMLLKNKSKNEKIYILTIALITAAGLLHCMYYVRAYGAQTDFFHYDEKNYIACAKRIAEEGRFSFWGERSDAYVTPGFPLFMALFFKLFGSGAEGIYAIRIFQGFLGGSLSLMTALMAGQLSGRKSVAVIASIVVALNAQIATYCRYMLTETLYFFFLLLFCNIYFRALKTKKRIQYAWSGALFAAAIMVRPPVACIIPLLLLFVLIDSSKLGKDKDAKKQLWHRAAAFAGAFIIVCLPWWIRNMVTLREFILFSTQTNAFFYGFCEDPLKYNLQDPGTIWGNLKYIWMFFKDDPLGMLYYMSLGKFKGIFLTDDVIVRPALYAANHILNSFTVALGFTGLIVSMIATRKYRRIAITILYFVLMTFLVIPVARYGVQFAPFLAVFGALLTVNAFRTAGNEE